MHAVMDTSTGESLVVQVLLKEKVRFVARILSGIWST
jgi:hypothetical protein